MTSAKVMVMTLNIKGTVAIWLNGRKKEEIMYQGNIEASGPLQCKSKENKD